MDIYDQFIAATRLMVLGSHLIAPVGSLVSVWRVTPLDCAVSAGFIKEAALLIEAHSKFGSNGSCIESSLISLCLARHEIDRRREPTLSRQRTASRRRYDNCAPRATRLRIAPSRHHRVQHE